MKQVWPIFVVLAAALAAWVAELTVLLGAHPWWAASVLWLGTALGLALAWLAAYLRVSYSTRLITAAVLTAAAYATASLGKARFAETYAEDALAGQMWYFGWIATCAFAAAMLAGLLWRRPLRA